MLVFVIRMSITYCAPPAATVNSELICPGLTVTIRELFQRISTVRVPALRNVTVPVRLVWHASGVGALGLLAQPKSVSAQTTNAISRIMELSVLPR